MTNDHDPVFAYMTAPDEAVADRIAAALVEERLAACVNLIPGMRSVYFWEGAVRSGAECVVIAKTKAALMADLTAAVKRLHPDDCPCVVALPLAKALGNTDFLDWIANGTR